VITVEEVRLRIAEIFQDGHCDPESAHGYEDDLYKQVLRAIADGHPNAAAIAAEVLALADLDFQRWYA
jgi:hypothetical protein